MRGVAENVQGDEGTASQAAAGMARRGAVASFSSAFWQEEEDAPALGGPARWLGCQVGWACWRSWARLQGGQVRFLPFLIWFLFSIYLLCFDLV